MAESVRGQIEIFMAHLEGLIRQGREIRDSLQKSRQDAAGTKSGGEPRGFEVAPLAKDPANPALMARTREWQEHCGVTINQLSGGSKAHWLARAYSQSFLMRATDGRAAEGAEPAEIVTRLLEVLAQAVASVSGMSEGADGGGEMSAALVTSSTAPAARRFEFVHNAELRPVVEQAYLDSRRELEQGNYEVAMRTSCGILEAIVTDALEHAGLSALRGSGAAAAPGNIADWSFDMRLAVAERAGIIRGGCARLPAIARTYREHTDGGGENRVKIQVSERDARRTGQVLHVVMRDLDPGR
jgi:hypothetical protein